MGSDIESLALLERLSLRNNERPMTAAAKHGSKCTAVCAVFDTTRLLEMILLHLPPRDTIVSMRVCQRWNECSHSSPAMAQHLFMRPSGSLVQQIRWRSAYRGKAPLAGEPLLASFKFATTTASKAVRHYHPMTFNEAILAPVRLAPLLRLHWDDQPITKRLSMSASERVSPIADPGQIGRWSGMYLTNPPAVEVNYHFKFCHSENADLVVQSLGSVARTQGVTLRDVMDQAASARLTVSCGFPVDWEEWRLSAWQTHWRGTPPKEVMEELVGLYGGWFGCSLVKIDLQGALVMEDGDWAVVEE